MDEERRKRAAESQEGASASSYYCIDYSRGYPETDDLAVFREKDSGSYTLCILDKGTVNTRRAAVVVNGKPLSGRAFDVDLVPDEEFSHKAAEKLLVIDRPLCAGDLVTRFNNAHVGTDKEREMWNNEDNDLGIVVSRKIVADISVYPEHKYIIRGVRLDREGVAPQFEKDYVVYGQWLGRAKNYVYNVHVNYKDKYRAVVKVSHGKDGIVLRRPHSFQTTFPFVKEEIVVIPKNNQFVKWKGIAPRFVRRTRTRTHRSISDTVPARVDWSELYEVEIDWFYSPLAGHKPPRILKGEVINNLVDLVPEVNFLNCALNSVTLVPQETDTILTMSEYQDELEWEFDGKFEKFQDNSAYGEDSGDEEMSPKRARLEQDEQDESLPGPSTEVSFLYEECEPTHLQIKTPTRNKRYKKITEKGEAIFGKIFRTRTFVSVKWPNGNIEQDIPSHLLVPQNPDIDQENHVIDSIVTKKTYTGDTDNHYGVIRKVDEGERSCLVRWFTRAEAGTNFDCLGDEECTLFDIMKHPKYSSDVIGSFGIDPQMTGGSLKDLVFNFVENLDNGRMKVKYIDGRMKEINVDEMMVIPLEDEQEAEADEEENRPEELTSSFIWDKLVRGMANCVEIRLSTPRLFAFPPQDASSVLVYISYKLKYICGIETRESIENRLSEYGQFDYVGREMDAIISDLKETGSLKWVARIVTEITQIKTTARFSDDLLYFLYSSEHHEQVSQTLANMPEVKLLIEMGNFFQLDTRRNMLLLKMKRGDFERIKAEHGWGGDDFMSLNSKQLFFFVLVYRFLTGGQDLQDLVNFYEGSQPSLIKVEGGQVPKSFCFFHQADYEGEEMSYYCLFQTICQMATSGELSCIDTTRPASDAVKVLMEVFNRERQPTGLRFNYRETVLKEILKGTDPDDIRRNGRATIPKPLPYLLSATMARTWHRLNLVHYGGYPLEHVKHAIENFGCPTGTGKLRTICVFELSCYLDPCPDTSEHVCARQEIQRWWEFWMERAISEHVCLADQRSQKSHDIFSTLPECPAAHKFYETEQATHSREMWKAIRYEHGLFKELPDGIFVRTYENRADLLTVLIVGPDDTPYEGVPFVFDILLPETYPSVPPKMAFVPWCKEQLNPNLYQEGKVCVSLLGTWDGKGTENWVPFQSSLLQLFISIQSMILVAEPFYNEAGYEARKQEPDTISRSQRYSEGAAINAFEYMLEIYKSPPLAFGSLVNDLIEKKWLSGYGETVKSWAEARNIPSYPTLGPSKGFQLAVRSWHAKIDGTIRIRQRRLAEEAEERNRENSGWRQEPSQSEDPDRETLFKRYGQIIFGRYPCHWIIIPENETCFAGVDVKLEEKRRRCEEEIQREKEAERRRQEEKQEDNEKDDEKEEDEKEEDEEEEGEEENEEQEEDDDVVVVEEVIVLED